MKLHVKTGQTVKVIAGKDKGKTGQIVQVLPSSQQVIVDGINKMFKHVKYNQQTQKGERIQFWGPIHVSNVKLVKEQPKKDSSKKEKEDSKADKK